MAAATIQAQTKDYVILGPTVKPDNGVVEAIYSLFYLPDNYRLILPLSMTGDHSFHDEITTLIQQNALGNRVHFISADHTKSPEGFASLALGAARTVA